MSEQTYVPAHLAIEAMRDNGYKNTAYAVAELIDNSIQAEATIVQLLCAEREEQLTTRKTKKIDQIAVLDNGTGMNREVLQMALQFGNGTRLRRDQRKGIGRFGMGLPASSVSQCKRVDVWSWQDGIENALHIYLDIDEIKANKSSHMPEPTKNPIPEMWKKAGIEFGKTGTLVVWSKLDRLIWSKGSTLLDNSEFLIGRMYRKFLAEEKVKIHLTVFDINNPCEPSIDKLALPNDPCYLMKNTSCPEPFNEEPMFEPFGDEARFSINYMGEEHEIIIRLSCAKAKAREKQNAGSTPYGKHAAKNVGISIVRAGRELDMDQTLVIQYDPTERWWGIELEFPPALDELMGVTNNKQSARNLTDVFKTIDNIEELLKGGKTIHQVKAELEEEGDPRYPLIEIGIYIKNQLKVMRELLKHQTKGIRSAKRYEDDIKAEKTATIITDERKQKGLFGTSDKDENKPLEVKEQEIQLELIESGVDEQTAKEVAVTAIKNNLKYSFARTPFESDAFFTVRPRGGTINIILNTRHPAYEHLVEVLEEETSNCDQKQLEERLSKASEGLKLLLMAWARYEDELPEGNLKEQAQDARSDWGRMAKQFLKNINK
jgi:hypothetical protein